MSVLLHRVSAADWYPCSLRALPSSDPVLETERQSLGSARQDSTLGEITASKWNISNAHLLLWNKLCQESEKKLKVILPLRSAYVIVVFSFSADLCWRFGLVGTGDQDVICEVISGSGHWELREAEEGWRARHRERGGGRVHSPLNNWNLSRIPDGAGAARKMRIYVFTQEKLIKTKSKFCLPVGSPTMQMHAIYVKFLCVVPWLGLGIMLELLSVRNNGAREEYGKQNRNRP